MASMNRWQRVKAGWYRRQVQEAGKNPTWIHIRGMGRDWEVFANTDPFEITRCGQLVRGGFMSLKEARFDADHFYFKHDFT